MQMCLNWILKQRVLLALEPSLCVPKQGAESEPYILWKVAPSDKRAGDSSWKLCSPVVLQLRGKQVGLIVSRAKPIQSMECSHIMHRQGD